MRINSRSDSLLDNLPADKQQAILHLLEIHPIRSVFEQITASPPNGMGIATHMTSLRRFYARQKAIASKNETALLVRELLSNPHDPALMQRATAVAAHELALDLASGPGGDTKAFKVVSVWLAKIQEIEQEKARLHLRMAQLALEREKFQFNAARMAMNHVAGLEAILQAPGIDDEEKINRARKTLFGKIPEDLKS